MKSNLKILHIAIFLTLPLAARAGELEVEFVEAHPKAWGSISKASRGFEEANTQEREISEVGLERIAGYCGDCPVYTVIIKADGSFIYTGGKNSKHPGTNTGHLATKDVAPLFQYLRVMDYFSLDENYSTMATDQETVFTMAAKKAGQRKVVRNCGKSGPLKLWALENLIDGLLADTAMKPK